MNRPSMSAWPEDVSGAIRRTSTLGHPSASPPEKPDTELLLLKETPNGLLINLERVNTPSWFGGDIQNVQVHIEYQSDDRLRIKVRDNGGAFLHVARFTCYPSYDKIKFYMNN